MIRAVLFDNDGVMSRFSVPRFKMRRLAKDLRSHGIKTGMLTNVIWWHAQIYKFVWGSYRGFDVLLLSHKEGIAKPDPHFYRLAVKKLGVKPQEILFIDDREEFLAPAKKLGFKTLHSVSAKQVLRDTKNIIFQENGLKL